MAWKMMDVTRILFQSTPPRRGRLDGYECKGLAQEFQSTPPRRGRLKVVCDCLDVVGFNPRPREGGDLDDGVDFGFTYVSIHAPAKGATWMQVMIMRLTPCFNPRPREGGDMAITWTPTITVMFQSTPPRRGRLANACGADL